MGRLLPIFLLAGLLASGASPAAPPRPNIILAMADDLGWGHPGYNSRRVTLADGSPHPDQGWIHTPTMDAMAAHGLRFDRFYAASAVCSPTRGSVLTGRNPIRLGIPYANSGKLRFAETTLPEILARHGYRCGHFGKWHLGTLTTLRKDANRGAKDSTRSYSAPWHHGFDFCFSAESKVPTFHPYRKPVNNTPLPAGFNDPNFYGTRFWRMPATWNQRSGEGIPVPPAEINNPADGDSSRLLVRQAIPYIRSAVAEQTPFFLVLWFHTPHKPVTDPKSTAEPDSKTALKASIEDMDQALGLLRDELTTLGIRGNTLLWMTSDNGPEDGADSPNETDPGRSLASGRLRGRKRSLYEGGVRVPGLLEWPDQIPAGRITSVPAVTSDCYPTILDFLEISVPDQKPLDGISLRPVITGTATTRTTPIGFRLQSNKSWVGPRYKLIDQGKGWELFDLLDFPSGEEIEQNPVATAADLTTRPPAIREAYRTMLAEFTAWNEAVAKDRPYIHPSRPLVTLQAGPPTPGRDLTVTATFSKPVSQLHASEFTVSHGKVWQLGVTPSAGGTTRVSLPEGAAIDAAGNPNAASEILTLPPSRD